MERSFCVSQNRRNRLIFMLKYVQDMSAIITFFFSLSFTSFLSISFRSTQLGVLDAISQQDWNNVAQPTKNTNNKYENANRGQYFVFFELQFHSQ